MSVLSALHYLWSNGNKPVVISIAFAVSSLLVLAAAWSTVNFWPGNGPYDPLTIDSPLKVLSPQVKVGGNLIYQNNTCNRTGGALDVLYHVSWIEDDTSLSMPSFSGVFSNPPGCLHNITTILLTPEVGPGTWRRAGVAEFDHKGQHRSVSFTTGLFEVVP